MLHNMHTYILHNALVYIKYRLTKNKQGDSRKLIKEYKTNINKYILYLDYSEVNEDKC